MALVTGDRQTAAEAELFMPGAEAVVVKESIGRFAARSLHPEVACELIREGARRALERVSTLGPPAIELPARLDVTLRTAGHRRAGNLDPRHRAHRDAQCRDRGRRAASPLPHASSR